MLRQKLAMAIDLLAARGMIELPTAAKDLSVDDLSARILEMNMKREAAKEQGTVL